MVERNDEKPHTAMALVMARVAAIEKELATLRAALERVGWLAKK